MAILRFPLVRVAACFVPGIVWAFYFKPELNQAILVSAAISFLLIAAFFISRKSKTGRTIFGIMVCGMAFSSGVVTQSVHSFANQSNHYIHHSKEKRQQLSLVLRERLRDGQSAMRYFAIVKSLDGKPVSGKILLQFKGQKKSFVIGTKLIADGKIIRNKKPLNPGQFDYGNYLDNKSVPAQLYLNSSDFKVVGVEKNLWHAADALRNRIVKTLRNGNFGENELQVLHALILGQQQEISQEIIRDYQFAGAVHVLSVSGLHVGFVLLMINALLKRLPKTKRWDLVCLAIVILSLWGFAFIAGLSPSVVRSATMFSFVAVGMHLRRSTNIFHTLIVSILLILLVQPAFVFDVGFQLSYAALFFIVWLQPIFNSFWQPENKIVKYFWDILTVSFAAQLGTLPLSIYYFHQFPALFFVTNLVVIPMLAVIMAVGIAVVISAAFGFVLPVLTEALAFGIAFLNRIIKAIASAEDFVLVGIPCNFWILVAAYVAISAIVIWLKKPSGIKLNIAIFSVICFQVAILATYFTEKNASEFIVFNRYKESILAERHGENVTVFGKPQQTTESYALLHFADTVKVAKRSNTYYFGNKKILLLDNPKIANGINPDVLILSQSPKVNLERLLDTHQPEIIVADASNFPTYISRWKATCLKRKIPFHDTREKGFFKLSD